MANKGITYVVVEPKSKEQESVFHIQEQYKQYFFVPYPHLERAIADGHLLAAIEDSTVVGYVWSYRRDGFVKVRYLAVDRSCERSGHGKALVKELIRRNQEAYGIRLSCRTDYPGWNFWKKVGFTAVRNRRGRAKDGSTLTEFFYELNSLPLFMPEAKKSDLTLVAVDANVFFDLGDKARPHHTESAGLLADWLTSEVELCVTAAIHEDIGRSVHRDISTKSLKGWHLLEASRESFRCIHDQLVSIIGAGETDQDASDRNHLTHAIAENLSAFITRDESLLSHKSTIYDQFGISIQRPSDFIVDVDLIVNQDRYDRHDLTSIGMSLSRIRSLEEIGELNAFRRGNEREKILRSQVRTWLANPTGSEVWILSSNGEVFAMCALSRNGSTTEVPLFRCATPISNRRRGRTLMRYLASTLQHHAKDSPIIKVSDARGIVEHGTALLEAGFLQAQSALYKITLPGVWHAADAANEVARVGQSASFPNELAYWFSERFNQLNDSDSFLRLEHAIWPGKLWSDGIVGCVVVPIRPSWARALFDPNLGQAELWHQNADLLFNPASAYYSGSRIALQQGRILWYVSHSESYAGSKRIRACSQLTGRLIDEPINLYRRFRHFGVFSLRDVERIATESRPQALAMEFSNTELFRSPVTLGDARSVLNDEKQVFQWPTRVTEAEFFEIYERGRL